MDQAREGALDLMAHMDLSGLNEIDVTLVLTPFDGVHRKTEAQFEMIIGGTRTVAVRAQLVAAEFMCPPSFSNLQCSANATIPPASCEAMSM